MYVNLCMLFYEFCSWMLLDDDDYVMFTLFFDVDFVRCDCWEFVVLGYG